jgi:selenocysteine lyase/cysteine desulfurase
MDFDIDFARGQFPAFDQESLKDIAFFENAGGSYACKQVIDRLYCFYNERKMQPYWPANPSKLGGQEMDEARVRLSAMMGVAQDELSFGPSTTQNTYVLS